MRWALRFLLWATPLTWLATTFYSRYVRFLAGAASLAFAAVGIRMQVVALEVLAPVDLALFGALALSSFRTPWRLRLARLAIGVALLMLFEIVVVICGIALFNMIEIPPDSPLGVFFKNLVSLIGWAGAPVVWILLFKPPLLLGGGKRSPTDGGGHRGRAAGDMGGSHSPEGPASSS
jgi:hypothetical protein